jgi:uncharacterized protein YndB with AHSA1/START domain
MSNERDQLSLHIERVLPSPPSVVFDALIAPDQLARWWGPSGFTAPSLELDPRVGGKYRITMQPPEGELFHLSGAFREVEPPSRLSYTFRWEEPTPDDRETVVTLTLSDVDDATALIVDQTGFATEERRSLHERGWTESLERLHELVARERASDSG